MQHKRQMCYHFFMKTLYFVRHAKSSWKNPRLEDFDRPLNGRGKRDAPFMAKRLKRFKVKPDLILSSPALRAKKTAQAIAKSLDLKVTYEPRLYEASVETYLQILQELDDLLEKVIIVGHNPEITQTCEILSDTILGNIPTCGIVGIECDVQSFKELEEGSGRVLFFDYPKKHL